MSATLVNPPSFVKVLILSLSLSLELSLSLLTSLS